MEALSLSDIVGRREFVMVSNRLPVDRIVGSDGEVSWRSSPGGLVTAVEPIVRELGCLWIGWPGAADEEIEPFAIGSMRLEPVSLSASEVADYYEGFSNATLWPLYHDVIAQPEFHREWWEAYRAVNRRFAERVAATAGTGAIVWVHDYQLQLVPQMLRELRPDLTISFFLHIPFPPRRMFAQLPWRRQIVQGMLGADVIGFQRVGDATAFRMTADRYARAPSRGNTVVLPATPDAPARDVVAQEFPISIDTQAFSELAQREDVQERARQIRKDLGDPGRVMLGVDRLDYTKGIRHRIKAFGELLEEGDLDPRDTVLVQVASPSRERVEAYQQLRSEVEGMVARINGRHGSIGHSPIVYLHQGYPKEEMAALYLAADVMLVTPLRDGMNLVAKEYVSCRNDERGVLLLSEFTGAADELRDALLVNPHDIDGLKASILRAAHMPESEQQRRLRDMRRVVFENDVAHWAGNVLGTVAAYAGARDAEAGGVGGGPRTEPIAVPNVFVPRGVDDRIRRLATAPSLIVASDFDGTLAPLVDRPNRARILPRAQQALDVLRGAPGVEVVLLSGRSLESLAETGLQSEGWIVSGSHGAELSGLELGSSQPGAAGSPLSDEERERLARITRRFERVFGGEAGVMLETKPFGIAVHTRRVPDAGHGEELLAAAAELGLAAGMHMREGKMVREFAVRTTSKGEAIAWIRSQFPAGPVLFLGDDVTDEDVFRVLGPDDLGIKVGEGETLASERVTDTSTAAAVLALLARLRTGIVIGS